MALLSGILHNMVGTVEDLSGVLIMLLSVLTMLILVLVGTVLVMLYLSPPEVRAALKKAMLDLRAFYGCFYYFWWKQGTYQSCAYFTNNRHRRVHLYSMALVFRIWKKDSYRHQSFQDDMKKNLRNVAIPGTGIPLSVFAFHKVIGVGFVLFLYPLAALAAAVEQHPRDIIAACDAFVMQLLEPQDWFSYWRLNCRLASYHHLCTKEKGYGLEDKLDFLQQSENVGIAVTPYLKIPGIVAKHRNEEGGLGFQSFTNATCGGDWILQETLKNDPVLLGMLPEDPPLSTFRVVTSSRGGLKSVKTGGIRDDDIEALCCVWRAGHAGAKTDHSSILFDVDKEKGQFKKGTTNEHWYKLGILKNMMVLPWKKQLTSAHDVTVHPDSKKQITGKVLESPNDIKAILDFARDAHKKLAKEIPLIGWDVALTNKGMVMLECNLSCNFFRGAFNQEKYFKLVEEYFVDLEETRPGGNTTDWEHVSE